MLFNKSLSNLRNASLLLSIPISILFTSITSGADAATLRLRDYDRSGSSNIQLDLERSSENRQFLKDTTTDRWVIHLNQDGANSFSTKREDLKFTVGNHSGKWDFQLKLDGQNSKRERLIITREKRKDRDFLKVVNNEIDRNFIEQDVKLQENAGTFIVKGNGRGTLTVTATVPEPVSTTAAVGLAIAGAVHTLKKKRTEDA